MPVFNLRLSDKQHAQLTRDAAVRGYSINTLILERLFEPAEVSTAAEAIRKLPAATLRRLLLEAIKEDQ